MGLPDTLRAHIAGKLQLPESQLRLEAVSGGCISRSGKLVTPEGNFFLKYNTQDFFTAEAAGLDLLRKTQTAPIPEIVQTGETDGYFYILLQWLEPGKGSEKDWAILGRRLAQLHRNTHTCFGLEHDNFIGPLPQSNRFHEHWTDFFIHERIEPQLILAGEKRKVPAELRRKVDALCIRLPSIMPAELPALLHGDLWSGNVHQTVSGGAYLIDPAVYYGHREAELAFTRLFGGFAASFYTTYREEWPLEAGFEIRTDVYNLYPLLVHWNLFGDGYLPQIMQILYTY